MTVNTEQNADSYYKRGLLLCAQGDSEGALEYFQAALDIDDAHAPSYAKIAEILTDSGEILSGIGFFGLAVKADPQNAGYAAAFLKYLTRIELQIFNPELKSTLLLCLKNSGADFQPAAAAWLSLLKLDPDFRLLFKAAHQDTHKAFKKMLLRDFSAGALCDPFFVLALTRMLVFDPLFERFLTGLRRMLLEELTEPVLNLPERDFIALTAALAQYCYTSEYIFAVEDEEQAAIEALQQTSGDDAGKATVLACYRPLHTLDGIENIRSKMPTALSAQQLDEWQSLQECRKTIAPLTAIEDGVSQKVRGQYEEFPYPRWRYIEPGVKNEDNEGFLRYGSPEILIAGCGTGREAVELAATYPQAHVLAVDLSLTSLSYGAYKAKALGIDNVTFKQADILKLGAMDRRFDFIASSGVLHHMADPEAGWEVLCGLLKPGGIMRIALYSETARRAISAAHKIIKENGYSDDGVSIRRFRHDAPDLLDKHTLDRIRGFRDYYNMSECRDLLFHVQEQCFDIPRLKAALEKLGLEFRGFYLRKAVRDEYCKAYPGDPALADLDNWRRFEQSHPDTFTEMYRFWCVKPE